MGLDETSEGRVGVQLTVSSASDGIVSFTHVGLVPAPGAGTINGSGLAAVVQMSSVRLWPVACLVTSLMAMSNGLAGAQAPESQRLAAALEALIATGPSGHTTHDAGEWLQVAVTDAIKGGDRAIERLAVRAASPLRAHITIPVSSTESLPHLDINTQGVLKVPRPIDYSAQILVSLDGAEFVKGLDVRSGSTQALRLDRKLGPSAELPGFHSLRVKARLTFGGAKNGPASWTEVRDLPELFYAVYDLTAEPTPGSIDVRAFVYGPASVASSEFDSGLGSEPFAVWLSGVLSARSTTTDPDPLWVGRYCSERTAEVDTTPVPTAICSVVYFQAAGTMGQVWFRTGDIRTTDDGIKWERVTPPRFEGFAIRGSAPESQRLSALPVVLDTDPALRPVGDVAISPDDIVVVPSDPRPGAPVSVTITVRNQGSGDLFKVSVQVLLVSSRDPDGSAARQFVVDLPAQGSTAIKFEAALPLGYGVLQAIAMQLSDHSPFESPMTDPTPEDACAFRIVNLRAAPKGYVESLGGDWSQCRGK